MRKTVFQLGLLAAVLLGLNACNGEDPPDNGTNGGDARLPVYEVATRGATAGQAATLASALNVSAEAVTVDDSIVGFLDPERYAAVPLGQPDTAPSRDEEGETQEITFAAIDFAALEELTAPDAEVVSKQFGDALASAELSDLFPQGGSTTTTQHTVFEWKAVEAGTAQAVQLDTRVAYDFALGEDALPLLGPGATVYATFDGSGPTSLRYAFRGLQEGETVPVISDEEAQRRCRDVLGRSQEDVRVEARMVYYAPPLELGSVATIMPHVECSGTANAGDEEVALLQRLLPAVDDSAYVPSADLDVQVEGAEVRATVNVEGGRAPYTVSWSSTHADLGEAPTSPSEALEYEVNSRDGAAQDTLTASVTDANGIEIQARQTFDVEARIMRTGIAPQVGGTRDFGTENAVTNEFGALESGFRNQMTADGVTRRFSWTGANAWERDFKSPGDSTYIDNTDITFYVGHGYGGGFTFEDDTHDDDRLTDTDADGDWGDNDLEWLALYSCQVLRDEFGGESYFDRWLDEFDGLHLLLGFHTNAYVRQNFSSKFASNMVDHNMAVRSAWLKASDDTQPNGVVTRVMGVFGTGTSSIYDHFWGHGSVSPDLRGNAISGWWSITRTVN